MPEGTVVTWSELPPWQLREPLMPSAHTLPTAESTALYVPQSLVVKKLFDQHSIDRLIGMPQVILPIVDTDR